MPHETNFTSYSDIYREQLTKAILESRKLGFERPAIISADVHVSDEILRETSQLLSELSGLFDLILPGYWGNSCQTLSTNIFARLNQHGIPANIVLGNVLVNGTDEFEATLERLQCEVRLTEPLSGDQHVHAWISLGDDTVVDAALPPRLVKLYKAPQQLDGMIFIGRAGEMKARFGVQYVPLLVGTEFFARTNPPDPMKLLNTLISGRAR